MANVAVEVVSLRPQIFESTFKVERVESKKQLWDFIKLPWRIYKGDANWVPPLLRDEKYTLNRNEYPFHKYADVEYFLARDIKGKPVGRIAAIVNHRYNEFHKERHGFFGFFECIDDSGVAGALLKSAEDWVRAKGMTAIKGPCNFSTNETLGMLLDCFNPRRSFLCLTISPITQRS